MIAISEKNNAKLNIFCRTCEIKLQRMQSIIKLNSENCKEKYKTIFLDITKKFEEKVNVLIVENFNLKTELISLKQKC